MRLISDKVYSNNSSVENQENNQTNNVEINGNKKMKNILFALVNDEIKQNMSNSTNDLQSIIKKEEYLR